MEEADLEPERLLCAECHQRPAYARDLCLDCLEAQHRWLDDFQEFSSVDFVPRSTLTLAAHVDLQRRAADARRKGRRRSHAVD
jgi:hypothetical protein